MKSLTLFFLIILSLPAFSYINEVECVSTQSSMLISMDIERPFPTGSTTRWARLWDDNRSFSYYLTGRRLGQTRLQYSGPGTVLDLDLWPDTRPTWGRTYQARLSSRDVRNGQPINLSCRFPYAE